MGRLLIAAGNVFVTLAAAGMISGATAEPVRVAKDTGPVNAACDQLAKSTESWRVCAARIASSASDTELFYAGYWLAKSGRYAEALTYLKASKAKDARVLTYIGYATRKSGDVEAALPIYAQALSVDPNFVVARAYLGEAYLAKRLPAKAKAELAEIATRCGTACPAYGELAAEITAFEAAKG